MAQTDEQKKAAAAQRRRLAKLRKENAERTRYVSFADYRAAQAPAEKDGGES